MNFAESQRRPGKHPTGLLIVIVMHVLLAYALVSGMARKVVDRVMITETKLIAAPPPPAPPPPPPPPPRPPRNPTPPRSPPPPIYAPPPPVDVPLPPPRPQAPLATATLPPPSDVRAPAAVVAPPAPRFVTRPASVDANDPACKPDYPAAAARADAAGVSHIRLSIDASGKVTSTEVIRPSGPTRENRILDNAAKLALATCPIKPGIDAEGHPVGSQIDVNYVWTLPN